ncbi:uncharacterized protein LY79DRAFT_147635 [Colletotrichum navitas]|uniref:Uncharacterized protein n=1 Tax=Colletotrichum navitas TaxID=681940 RepID=A0AAD8QBS1_9PEZI|nr:uncharacterized protein LY79DRAFT_147635 [Colletotrichum navitas]KAK1599700.1 hypothetical protein LY79DRAFT_147635 [Colletotrichum navitas]
MQDTEEAPPSMSLQLPCMSWRFNSRSPRNLLFLPHTPFLLLILNIAVNILYEAFECMSLNHTVMSTDGSSWLSRSWSAYSVNEHRVRLSGRTKHRVSGFPYLFCHFTAFLSLVALAYVLVCLQRHERQVPTNRIAMPHGHSIEASDPIREPRQLRGGGSSDDLPQKLSEFMGSPGPHP